MASSHSYFLLSDHVLEIFFCVWAYKSYIKYNWVWEDLEMANDDNYDETEDGMPSLSMHEGQQTFPTVIWSLD